MGKREIEAAIGGADPLERAKVRPGAAEDSKQELLKAIVRHPQEARPDRGERRRPGIALPGSSRFRRGAYLALASTLTALAVLGLSVGGLGGIDPTGPPPSAEGAGLAHLAGPSPHLVLALPGWRIGIAEQTGEREGTILFVYRDDPERNYLDGRLKIMDREQVRLDWHDIGPKAQPPFGPGKMRFLRTSSVLGASAWLYSDSPGPLERAVGTDFRAVWRRDGQRIDVDSSAPSLEVFERRLAALRQISSEAWVQAVPGQIVSQGRTISANEVEGSEISLRCKGPLPEDVSDGEPPFVVGYYEKECARERPGSRSRGQSATGSRAASASREVVIYGGLGSFEEVAVYVYPYAIGGEHLQEVSMCLQLSGDQHEYLSAHGNAPLAWAIVAEQSCVSVFRNLGTVSKAVAERLAQENIGPARREQAERR